MADQGKWWKLWCTSLRDDDLENMSIHEWFGWARLGAHIKENGRDGKIRFTPPGRTLLHLLRLDTYEAAIAMIKRFPNVRVGEREVTVTTVTNATVTHEVEYLNWFKFQGDFSNDRVRKFRDKKRHRVTAQEERRRRREVEEKRITPTPAGVSAAPYERPDKGRDPTSFLVMTYKEGLGVPFDDRAWDKQFWGRWSKEAKTILDSLGGIDDAVSYLQFQAKQLSGKDLTWTLKTVADRAVLYAAKKRGKNESPHRKRVPSADAEPGASEDSGGLRKLSAGGPVLDVVRGREEVADGN